MTEEADHEMALPPGTELDDYRIEGELGHGSFGITYLARDRHLAERVAIKEYMPRDVAYRSASSEVRALSRVDSVDVEFSIRSK